MADLPVSSERASSIEYVSETKEKRRAPHSEKSWGKNVYKVSGMRIWLAGKIYLFCDIDWASKVDPDGATLIHLWSAPQSLGWRKTIIERESKKQSIEPNKRDYLRLERVIFEKKMNPTLIASCMLCGIFRLSIISLSLKVCALLRCLFTERVKGGSKEAERGGKKVVGIKRRELDE